MNAEMKAVVLHRTCEPEDLFVERVPIPMTKPGWVLVRVRAFGLNHSELILRRHEGDASYIRLPRIPGIECVGEIADPSDSRFRTGQRVVALMGGMGRSFDGSYAEYALLPAHHVFSVCSELDWTELAAIPETFYTAYGSLFTSLLLEPGNTLLIRGGTSALGLAAAQLAKAAGCRVLSTTRRRDRFNLLHAAGVDVPLLDDGTLSSQMQACCPDGVDKALELVGVSVMAETMRFLRPKGILCMSGNLGNGSFDGFHPIKSIPNGRFLSGFHSNDPTQEVIDDLFRKIRMGGIQPIIGAVFPFERLPEAHRLMESDGARGKVVVRVE